MSDLCVVTDPRPRKKIRVGNGKLLQVTAIGKVRMKVATRGGQHETMELSNVYVVPEMKCRLLSSNWAWQYDNVSTHLNDDRFLRLPSGARVPFVTDTGDGKISKLVRSVVVRSGTDLLTYLLTYLLRKVPQRKWHAAPTGRVPGLRGGAFIIASTGKRHFACGGGRPSKLKDASRGGCSTPPARTIDF